jgi:ABC-2 type transport system permease protein
MARRADNAGDMIAENSGMMSFFRIARFEMRRLYRDATLLLSLGAMALLLLFATINGRAYVRFQQATIAAARAEEAKRLDGLKEQISALAAGQGGTPSAHSDPRRPANVGGRLGKHWAVLPPVPVIGALSVGQSDLHPFTIAVTSRGRETLLGNSEIENPLHLLAGRFDPAFVLVYLFPLFLVALGYNLLAEERESGTLALLLSQPVTLHTVLWAKVAARLAAFVLPVAAAVVEFLLASGAASGETVTTDAVTRLFLIALLLLAYGLFWLSLAAGINIRGGGSAGNASTLTGLYLLLVLVLPAAMQEAAGSLYPVPSGAQLIETVRAASTEATERGSRLLAQFYEDHPELASAANRKPADPKDFSARRAVAAEAVEKEIAPVLARYAHQLGHQQAWMDRARHLSPTVALQEALNDAAGTGRTRRAHFEKQLDRFHNEWKAFFLTRTLRRDEMTTADLGNLPRFHYREPDEADVLARIAAGFPGLVVGCLLLLLATNGSRPRQ